MKIDITSLRSDIGTLGLIFLLAGFIFTFRIPVNAQFNQDLSFFHWGYILLSTGALGFMLIKLPLAFWRFLLNTAALVLFVGWGIILIARYDVQHLLQSTGSEFVVYSISFFAVAFLLCLDTFVVYNDHFKKKQ